jgi:hypothetical protein
MRCDIGPRSVERSRHVKNGEIQRVYPKGYFLKYRDIFIENVDGIFKT